MGKLLCEKNLRDVWCRNEGVRAEIGQILHTHTHTRLSYSSNDGHAGLKCSHLDVCFAFYHTTIFFGSARYGSL